MRFTSFLVAGALALTAAAQSTPTATTSATVTSSGGDPAETSAQSAMIKCIEACDPSDVDCRAQCITVPSPNEQQANQTTECAAACPQGNGTQAETDAFAKCVQDCISKYFYSTGSAGPTAKGSGSNNGAASTTVEPVLSTITSGSTTFISTVSSRTVTNAPNSSGTSATAASGSPTNAAGAMFPSGSVGLLGLIAAIFAI